MTEPLDGEAEETADVLRAHLVVLEGEVAHLRHKLVDAPKRVRALEERLLEIKGQLAHLTSQNERLSYTLREAREHISSLREEVDRLIDHLIPQFKREFTAMVMITRGGVIPGGMLAEAMDITHILTAAVDFPAQSASERARLMAWPALSNSTTP